MIDPNASFAEATAETEAQIVEIGYELMADKTAVGPMGQVADLTVTPGDADGALDWGSHPEPGASGYEPRTTTDPNNPALWKNHMVVTQSSGTSPLRTQWPMSAHEPMRGSRPLVISRM